MSPHCSISQIVPTKFPGTAVRRRPAPPRTGPRRKGLAPGYIGLITDFIIDLFFSKNDDKKSKNNFQNAQHS